jgi:hypothetical protein
MILKGLGNLALTLQPGEVTEIKARLGRDGRGAGHPQLLKGPGTNPCTDVRGIPHLAKNERDMGHPEVFLTTDS